jgi:hypothetical protein
MSGMFSSPSPPPPDPKVAEAQAKQEKRIEEQEATKQRQIAASSRARRTGGMRLLFSQDRENPALGIPSEDKLGGG